ncbi:unnamed protein product [Rotaria sp. Silwood1]|nr:unnamed protein product [Rotaria sp. Silwood1]
MYLKEKSIFLQKKIDDKISYISTGNNIWKYVHPTSHPYTPAFEGLTTPTGIITDQQTIVDTLANFYETHFEKPSFDTNNLTHLDALKNYENSSQLPNFSLENIALQEVEKNWKKAHKKKKYADDNLLPVNINKTKALLVHDVVASSYPEVKYKGFKTDFVKCFEYLGLDITTKLGKWLFGYELEKSTVEKVKPESLLELAFIIFAAPYACFLKDRHCYALPEVTYENLISKPEETIGVVFDVCGISKSLIPEALTALNRDSQAGTLLSRDKMAQVKSLELSKLDRKRLNEIAKRMELPESVFYF